MHANHIILKYIFINSIGMKPNNNLKGRYTSQKSRGSVVRNKQSIFEEQTQDYIFSQIPSHKPSISKSQIISRPHIKIEEFLQMFTAHYVAVEECFKRIDKQFTRLEAKIADCYGRFNEIEWRLSRSMHQIEQAKNLNESLLRINTEIEQKLACVKNDYEELKKRKYISSIEQKIEELKECVHNLEIQNYKSKFNKHESVLFEENIDRLELIAGKAKRDSGTERQIYCQIITDLIKYMKGNQDIGRWMEDKLQENIKLRFQLIKNEAKIIQL